MKLTFYWGGNVGRAVYCATVPTNKSMTMKAIKQILNSYLNTTNTIKFVKYNVNKPNAACKLFGDSDTLADLINWYTPFGNTYYMDRNEYTLIYINPPG